MSRVLSGALASHLATRRTTLARCLRLDLTDGTALGFTTLDIDLSVNLGDGALSYAAGTGVTPSALALSLGFDADNLEARGPIGSVVTRAAVLGGRYRAARARLFDVNWADTSQRAPLLAGKLAAARVEGAAFVFEIRSAIAAYNQTIGRVLSPYCDADFGDARCGAAPLSWAATVASVTDALTLSLSFSAGTPTAAQALAGKINFTSGALVGQPAMEVFGLAGGVTLSLYAALAEAPQVGDALTLTEGCDKRRATCVAKQGDATTFRGFPDLVGSDDYLKFPSPGS